MKKSQFTEAQIAFAVHSTVLTSFHLFLSLPVNTRLYLSLLLVLIIASPEFRSIFPVMQQDILSAF